MPTRAAKDALRQRMRALRAAVPREDVARWSQAACAHVLALPELQAARVVALYAPIAGSGELDTAPIRDGLRARGVITAYPRVRGREQPLEFHAVADVAELVVGAFDVPQPRPEAPPAAEPDAFIVPGLAFGRDGERVGWGAGHYDRTLDATPRALRIGVAFDFQITAGVPQRPGDQLMDLVVTDAGVRVRRARSP